MQTISYNIIVHRLGAKMCYIDRWSRVFVWNLGSRIQLKSTNPKPYFRCRYDDNERLKIIMMVL